MAFADWRKVLSINLDGRFLMAKAVVPHMRAAKYCRIVNISSAECWMAASDNRHYIASKMDVIGLTRATVPVPLASSTCWKPSAH